MERVKSPRGVDLALFGVGNRLGNELVNYMVSEIVKIGAQTKNSVG